jgi:hypothetical protein
MDKPTDRIASHYAQQPQNQQNYKNRPKHFVSLLLSTTPKVFVGTKAIAEGIEQRSCRFGFLGFWAKSAVRAY